MTRAAVANLAWPERKPIHEWARDHVSLTPRQATAYAGPYRVEVTPYIRGIFDALADPAIHRVVVEKGAQTGLTLAAYVWLCYLIAEEPGSILVVMPTEQLARSASETRLQPMLVDSPTLRRHLPADPDAFKKLEYQLDRCTLNWVGSNSPSNLASRPIRYLLVDEVDKYPGQTDREGDAVALAVQRTKSFWNRKIMEPSTPTVEDGQIHRDFLAGDQRRYFVPCHACGHGQFLKWSGVRWPKDSTPAQAQVSARYVCEACGAEWTDLQRDEAVKLGEWRATAQSQEAGVASFHLPSLLAPWTKFGQLAARWIQAQQHPDLLHDFLNSELAEPWKPEISRIDDGAVAERAADYKRGAVFARSPCFGQRYKDVKGMYALTVDVQKDSFWWVARAWMIGGDSGLIDWGRCHDWETLVAEADKLGKSGDGKVWVVVDSGYGERTQEVYEACLKHRFIPAKGASAKMTTTWTKSAINVFEGTRTQKAGKSLWLLTHDSIALKAQLYDRVQGRGPFAWYVPTDYGQDYAAQLQSEEFDGRSWKLRRGVRDNHLWDCEVLQLLAATVAGFNSKLWAN